MYKNLDFYSHFELFWQRTVQLIFGQILSDNAEQIVPNVLDAVMYAKRMGWNNINWILAARDTGWAAAWRKSSSRNEPNWSLYMREWPSRNERSAFFSMSRDESERVIAAWRKANCLGALDDLNLTDI